jgi:uncharacterized protein (TIGR00369 family)
VPGEPLAAARAPQLVTPHREPEALFGLGPVEVDGDAATATMRTAPWMVGPDGAASAGMLGVLFDDVVGQATLTARPDDHWPVTAELSIDVVAPLPADGTVLVAASRLLAAGPRTGSAQGEVRDPSGAVLAVATVVTQYVPGVPELDGTSARAVVPGAGGSLHEVLGGRLECDPGVGATMTVTPTPALSNVAGNGHGGVLAALADVVATAAVADAAAPLRTCGLRVAYLRPAVLDDPVRLEARVVHRGRSAALTRIDVTGGDGRLCTAATVTAGPRAGGFP